MIATNSLNLEVDMKEFVRHWLTCCLLATVCCSPTVLDEPATTTITVPSNKIRVAVIGAGPCGLITARYLSSKLDKFDLTVFERTNEVGGLWVYTNVTGNDANGVPMHTAAYDYLKTNVPKEVMMLEDFPFPQLNEPSFVSHRVIYSYLQNFTRHFKLFPHIKLNTLVTDVEPEISPSGQTTYRITSKDLINDEESIDSFDAVVVSVGHVSVNYIPTIRGSDTFVGTAIHSHDYRVPEKYSGRRVCIIGAQASGRDIALELSEHAAKVYLSDKGGYGRKRWLSGIEMTPRIIDITGNNLTFSDDTSVQVDDIIYCTGYQFAYPFLSKKIELSTADKNVEPLYKYLVHITSPNLFFMGVPDSLNFLLAELHAQYIVGLLEGRLQLPSSEAMREDMEAQKRKLLAALIPRREHLRYSSWTEFDQLATLANASKIRPVIRSIFQHCLRAQQQNVRQYKQYGYKIIDNENFGARLFPPDKAINEPWFS
ncbi:uncharacterized protein LOC135168305 [Diachasmimorpha longicaudata]|uniref:uncharacterized protein LOC135168305 n=1 Tax=Diachasmimorpha longicaudata TaxID=58733 RepID=UPI0030B907DB